MRATFAVSAGYPRKSSPHARLGTAFHDTLENLPGLVRTAEASAGLNLNQVRTRAVESFRQAVKDEKEKALKSPREAKDRWPEEKERRMQVQAALEAGRLANKSRPMPASGEHYGAQSSVALEETLVSDDGLLRGRPDRVEEGPSGTVIVDYKTGSLDDPDNLRRYEQQCVFYALLWRDRHG
ncbi:MAG: PD-(D/E)XK nuclease family protein, partial [Actinomycetota bacterium]|nr:PD-(D/E)XK nuclease family protein [Actinomycetota bacterium]